MRGLNDAGTAGEPRPTYFVLSSFPLSFAGFRLRLLRALRASGGELMLAAPGLNSETVLRERLSSLACRFVDLPMARTGTSIAQDLRTLWCLTRLLRTERPSHFLGYTAKPVVYGLLAARLAGVPRRTALITGLGYLFGEDGGAGSRLIRAFGAILYRAALAHATRVIFQNEDDRDLFIRRRLVRPDRTGVVNGSGVPLDEFPQQPLPPLGRECHFLLIARLLEDKGIREYAEAARRLRCKYPGAVFHLVGWHDDHPLSVPAATVRAWVDEGLIVWHGRLEDVRPRLAACHVYVLPSYREGTPRTVLEAMATGRPAVTTDAPGCRQTVVPGETGLLVPVRDAAALADALEYFLLRPGRIAEMGARARRHVERHYDVDLVNRQMLRLMDVAPSDAGMAAQGA